MTFTLIGSSGFIGAALANRLRAQGEEVFCPARGSAELFTRPLGRVVYAAGVTADFRARPFDALRANTILLAELLERANFDALAYLSSARIYRHAEHTREDAAIFLRPGDPEDLYDFTKLAGEALCTASGRPNVRVVRLTNVVGPDFHSPNFLSDLIRSACDDGQVNLRSALRSEKDYVLLEDVVDLIPRIATSGRQACYNLGSGRNVSHAEIVGPIVARSGARLSVDAHAQTLVHPPIDIARLQDEFHYTPRPVVERIPGLIDEYKRQK